jgi:hypothetical protein
MKSINADDIDVYLIILINKTFIHTKPMDKIPRPNENNKYKRLIEQEIQK